jgi:hypothetical protein
VAAVESPADAGFRDPVADQVEIVRLDAEAAGQDGLLQQIEYFARREAGCRERQQLEEGAGWFVDGAAGAASQGEGDVALARRIAEYRLDQRPGGFEVGGHYQDVRRGRRIASGQEGEELILQHFKFAGEGVADMDLDAAVAGFRDQAARGDVREVQDRVLQSGQQGI